MGYRWHFWSDWWGYAGGGLVDVERAPKRTYTAFRDASRPRARDRAHRPVRLRARRGDAPGLRGQRHGRRRGRGPSSGRCTTRRRRSSRPTRRASASGSRCPTTACRRGAATRTARCSTSGTFTVDADPERSTPIGEVTVRLDAGDRAHAHVPLGRPDQLRAPALPRPPAPPYPPGLSVARMTPHPSQRTTSSSSSAPATWTARWTACDVVLGPCRADVDCRAVSRRPTTGAWRVETTRTGARARWTSADGGLARAAPARRGRRSSRCRPATAPPPTTTSVRARPADRTASRPTLARTARQRLRLLVVLRACADGGAVTPTRTGAPTAGDARRGRTRDPGADERAARHPDRCGTGTTVVGPLRARPDPPPRRRQLGPREHAERRRTRRSSPRARRSSPSPSRSRPARIRSPSTEQRRRTRPRAAPGTARPRSAGSPGTTTRPASSTGRAARERRAAAASGSAAGPASISSRSTTAGRRRYGAWWPRERFPDDLGELVEADPPARPALRDSGSRRSWSSPARRRARDRARGLVRRRRGDAARRCSTATGAGRSTRRTRTQSTTSAISGARCAAGASTW